MKIVDEPAAEIEAQLRERGSDVSRRPYDPKSRNLVTDFFHFLRDPESGDTVTLFEDDRGRVRYYTVERVDPQIAQLNDRVAALDRVDPQVLEPRLDEIEAKLTRVDELRAKTAGIDEIETRLTRVERLEARVAKVEQIEAKVAKVDELEAKLERVDALEVQVKKLPALETQLTEIGKLSARITRLERPT